MTKKKAVKIKPCPFCGKTPRPYFLAGDWYIGCVDIRCLFTKSNIFQTEPAAIKAWNKRTK
jgi:hypothetical protein